MQTFTVANTHLRSGDIVHTPAGPVTLGQRKPSNPTMAPGVAFWTTVSDPKGWGEWSFNLNFDSTVSR